MSSQAIAAASGSSPSRGRRSWSAPPPIVMASSSMSTGRPWVAAAASSAEQYGLRFGDGLRIYVDAQQQRLVLERHYPQYGLCGTRSVPLTAGADLNLRIFFDSSSVEVFVNDGEACLSSRIYPQAPRRELALFAWSGSAALTEAGAWQLE